MNHCCSICKNKKYKIILNQRRTNIFTNAEDSKKVNAKIKCRLYQCLKCNFVFQIPSRSLKLALNKIYAGNNAQISQPLGEGNWGKERFNFLKKKLIEINKFKNKHVLELACGNGYLLKYLEKKGFKHLCGIDPSLNIKKTKSKIKYIKKFADSSLRLNNKFDLIFSIGLYEHAYSVNDLTKFSIKNLSTKGRILVVLPNFKSSLKSGNPDLFAHEHINYFTVETMIKHFKKFNLKVVKNFSDKHSIVLYLERNKMTLKRDISKAIYINYNYNYKLSKTLQKIEDKIYSNKVIVHGACNSLNNITNWINLKLNFKLTDNDHQKIGKIFFNKTVNHIKSINLNEYNLIIIVPTFFSKDIIKKFILMGYKGKFITVR